MGKKKPKVRVAWVGATDEQGVSAPDLESFLKVSSSLCVYKTKKEALRSHQFARRIEIKNE